ncbi:hypothetical protein SAMN04487895_101617 [Paenibacillus sophorae]|uniref:Uncharacterized protein n=1 Tax=Paenibacillus sophorae TaxID=1333845 RepID=A0A1H8GS46_9BACL|nr:hypothetical protein [Paenibacillus sophorae]QWU14314.1 hypothetical protein KP014_20625 [Paenibacillus sophorae]SEN46544.1 hypothetical protein SAMN04487895_101617 [Paenibacillus sophorae]
MKKYISKIDGTEFLSEDELIEYLKNTYVKQVDSVEDENGLSIENIYKKFRSSLPEYVDIKVKTDLDDGGYLVSLDSDICDFSFQIGEGEWNYYYHRFSDIEQAVRHYGDFFQFSERIIKEVNERFGIELNVHQMWEASGEGEHLINFRFNLNEYEEHEEYKFGDIEGFVKNFEQYVNTSIIGKMEIVREEYSTKITIDGVDISGFANRSKKVKLEIVE